MNLDAGVLSRECIKGCLRVAYQSWDGRAWPPGPSSRLLWSHQEIRLKTRTRCDGKLARKQNKKNGCVMKVFHMVLCVLEGIELLRSGKILLLSPKGEILKFHNPSFSFWPFVEG